MSIKKLFIYPIVILFLPITYPLSKIFRNLYKIKPADVIAIEGALKILLEKYGLKDDRTVLMKIMWFIMTNKNGERKRCRRQLGKFIEDNIK